MMKNQETLTANVSMKRGNWKGEIKTQIERGGSQGQKKANSSGPKTGATNNKTDGTTNTTEDSTQKEKKGRETLDLRKIREGKRRVTATETPGEEQETPESTNQQRGVRKRTKLDELEKKKITGHRP